jgi:hypothetical protein
MTVLGRTVADGLCGAAASSDVTNDKSHTMTAEIVFCIWELGTTVMLSGLHAKVM